MMMRTRIERRQFLVGTGVALAQTAIARHSVRAGSSAPPPPPDPEIAPAKSPASAAVGSKPGVAPGYIISGRGEDLGNPYFHPLGGPSTKPRPIPPEADGQGVDQNNQGESRQ
jgi:hypothetical protein